MDKGRVMKAPTANCDFCNEFSGDPQNTFNRIYRHDLVSRVLFRSKEFVVVPSLGQITEGHLLLLPIKHFTAFGELPESLLEEFTGLANNVAATITEGYGSSVAFEHGVRPGGSGGCGIYHAHLHAVPLANATDPVDALKLRFPYTELTRLDEISKRSAGLSSYLLYQDSHTRLYLFDTGPLPSQYMRKLLADALESEDWDWRTAGIEQRLLATMKRFSDKLKITREPAHASNI
jgi:diadenosine tetraphosphate (Ap4A) HIT family hydrolase